jgi:hypothetical protein
MISATAEEKRREIFGGIRFGEGLVSLVTLRKENRDK